METEKLKILVVGDVMIDRYTYVNTTRQAPEAPIPVWDKLFHDTRLGGAANVAHNLVALGGDEVEVFLAGIVSPNDKKMISRLGINTILCSGAESMYKDRFIEHESMRHLFRCDNIRSFSEEGKRSFLSCCEHFLRGHLFDAVIFSDYNKGTIQEEIVALASPTTKLVVVDSKRLNLGMYRGARVLKLNEQEYGSQGLCSAYPYVEALFDYVVVTKGARGAELRQAELGQEAMREGVVNMKYVVHSENFPVVAAQARDVTGCGDTHTAAMTFSLLKNGDVRSAVKFANECARNVVQKFGTSVVGK